MRVPRREDRVKIISMGPGPDLEIDCIDCGGRCHLLTTWPADDPPEPGDVMVYRCSDCADRWDVVFGDPDE